jgi:hypothetical protein
MERVMGIEPTLAAWEAAVLPLNYTRIFLVIQEFAPHGACIAATAVTSARARGELKSTARARVLVIASARVRRSNASQPTSAVAGKV